MLSTILIQGNYRSYYMDINNMQITKLEKLNENEIDINSLLVLKSM